MHRFIFIMFSLLVVIVIAIPASAVVNCHCFQDRTFDPQRSSAADSYFLATTQNSLLASALNVSKKTIVQAKMGGLDADLLWIAYYVADRSGMEISEIIKLYTDTSADWGKFVAILLKSSGEFDKPFVAALLNPENLKGIANGAYRSVLLAQLDIDEAVSVGLEIAGASRKEQIMAIFLSLLLGDQPLDIYKSVQKGQQTWGEVLASTGLDPKQIESSWGKLLKFHRDGFI